MQPAYTDGPEILRRIDGRRVCGVHDRASPEMSSTNFGSAVSHVQSHRSGPRTSCPHLLTAASVCADSPTLPFHSSSFGYSRCSQAKSSCHLLTSAKSCVRSHLSDSEI